MRESSAFEARRASAPSALGINYQRQPSTQIAPAPRSRRGRLRRPRKCPPRARCQPSTGKRQNFGDDAQLDAASAGDHGCVVNALMVRHEYVRRSRPDALQALHRHPNACRLQNQPRPRPRAAVREISAPIEQARDHRRRAQHDRVDGDGRNEEEDGPPPVDGGEFHN